MELTSIVENFRKINPYKKLQSNFIVTSEKTILAEIDYSAMDTSLEPHIGWDVQVKKVTKRTIHYYWDIGDKVVVEIRDKKMFTNIRQVV
jgi:hypothetical protein